MFRITKSLKNIDYVVGFPNPPTLHHPNPKIIILNVIFLSNNKLNLPKVVIKNKWEHPSTVVVSISPDMAAQVKKSHWKPMGNKFHIKYNSTITFRNLLLLR
jgi:hypothetical protein